MILSQLANRKSALWLHLAALAIVWTGLSFHPNPTAALWLQFAVLTAGLVFITYGFNDFIDKSLFKRKSKIFGVLLVATGMIVMGSMHLSNAAFNSVLFILSVGVLYSVPFDYIKPGFQIKRLSVVKNVLIALCWSMLLVLGSGTLSTLSIQLFMAFVFMQVFIGSVLRDIDDIEEDIASETRSIPATIGIDKTLKLLQIINILSLVPIFAFVFGRSSLFIVALYLIPALWRFLLIRSLQTRGLNKTLLQEMNLITCILIFLPRAIELWLS